jgi:hypothetical protein
MADVAPQVPTVHQVHQTLAGAMAKHREAHAAAHRHAHRVHAERKMRTAAGVTPDGTPLSGGPAGIEGSSPALGGQR